MRIALISDVHGNIRALKKVLEKIETLDIDQIICTGDLVGYLPNPNEVVNLFREKEIQCLKGNHEEYVLSLPQYTQEGFEKLTMDEVMDFASAAYMRYILTEENTQYLRSLPEELSLSLEGYLVLFVHGSPRAIDEYMFEDSEELGQMIKDTHESIIVAGHTHVPFVGQMEDKLIINAGSVGKPRHGSSHSTFGVLELTDDMVNVEFFEVEYDVDQLIEDIKACPYIPNELIDEM